MNCFKHYFSFILVVGLALASQKSVGQGMVTLTLRQAIAKAQETNRMIQVAALKTEAAAIKKNQQVNNLLPTVSVQSTYAHLSNNITPFKIVFQGSELTLNPIILNQYSNRLSINQPLFQGLKYSNQIKSAEQLRLAGIADEQRDKMDLSIQVVNAFYNIYKLQKALELVDSSIRQTETRLTDLKHFKNAGLVLNNDVMKTELTKNSLLVNKTEITGAWHIAQYEMCLLLGIPVQSTIQLDSADHLDMSALYKTSTTSQENRPEFKSMQFKLKAAQFQLQAGRSAYMPSLSAYGNGYCNNPNQRVFPLEPNFKATWDVGLSFSWNLSGLYTAHAAIQEAKNQKAQLGLLSEALKDNISVEVYTAQEHLKTSAAKIKLAQQSIEQASENKRILDNRFKAELALINDVLEADQLMLQAQTNLLNAKADAAVAYYKLLRSQGLIP